MVRRPHRAQHRFGPCEVFFRAAGHDGERAVCGARRTTADRRVDKSDAAFPQPLRKPSRRHRRYRRQIDDERAPPRKPVATPSVAKSASSTWGASGTQIATMSDAAATCAGLSASMTPHSARKRSSASRRRCAQAATAKPARRRERTIGSPMAPSPTNPTRGSLTARPLGAVRRHSRRPRSPSLGLFRTPPKPVPDRLQRFNGDDRRDHRRHPRDAPDVRRHEPLDGQAHAASPPHVRTRARERHADDAADRSRSRARADRLLRQPRLDRHRLDLPAGGCRKLLRHRAAHRAWPRNINRRYAGRVPLLLKVNGKTNIPPDDEAFQPDDVVG